MDNKKLPYARRQRRRRRTLLSSMPSRISVNSLVRISIVAAGKTEPSLCIAKDARLEQLDHCLQKLPEKQRALVDGYYFQQSGVETLAQQAQRSVGAVYKALQRIRRQLRECMERSLQEEASQ